MVARRAARLLVLSKIVNVVVGRHEFRMDYHVGSDAGNSGGQRDWFAVLLTRLVVCLLGRRVQIVWGGKFRIERERVRKFTKRERERERD